MSYRPENQSLAKPARFIISGVDDLISAFQERRRSNEFSEKHVEELDKLEPDLVRFRNVLSKLERDNW